MPPPPSSRPIVFTQIEQFGGAERAALALARWLTDRNLENHIVAYDDHSNLSSHASFPLEIIQLKPTDEPLTKIHALHKYFANRPPSAPRPLLSGYQPSLHATLAGLRGFHTLMHDTPSLFDHPGKPTMRRRISNRIVGYGLRSGGATIVASEFLRDECWRDFRVQTKIARMGGLPGTFAPRKPGNALRLLSVSRIEPNKRLDWLLDALAELDRTAIAPLTAPLSQLIDWRFDIVGKGPQLGPLRSQTQQLGLTHRVHFHGFVPDADLETMYRQADLFLMPALQGYGIPAIESLTRGIPVFLHRDSGVSDILLETPWATVMQGEKANTPAALAKYIDDFLHTRHMTAALPELPTEDAWAERVVHLCGWQMLSSPPACA